MHLDDLEARIFTAHPTTPTDDPMPPPICPQSAIVLCPADVLTVFYAVYPKFRPQAPTPLSHPPPARHARKPSEGSPKPEYKRPSGEFLRPILKKTQLFDLNDSSVSSQSDLSVPSEEDTLFDVEREEIDMYALSVKSAVDEMKRRLGHDGCLGERHPCEEMWSTLYVSQDGLSLSVSPEFELNEFSAGEDGPVILSKEEDAVIERALIKLAETRGMPLQPRSQIPEETPTIPGPSSLHHEDLMSLISPRINPSQPRLTLSIVGESKLLTSLRDASQKSYARGEYIEAHSFQHAYHLLKSVPNPQYTRDDYSPIISIIASKVQNRGNHLLSLVRTREVWFTQLFAERATFESTIMHLTTALAHVRCKMWYVRYVRDSKVWHRAEDVCTALQKMKASKPGMAAALESNRSSSRGQLHRSNSATRGLGSRFIPSRQSFDGFSFSARPASMYNVSLGMGSDDWFDILAAPTEQGGPHKLSDYQVEITNRWLEEHASENFCRGEEIIHRFMAEVDDVIRRLIPETVDEATNISASFWESEEFIEDAKEFGLMGTEKRVPKRDEGNIYGRRSEEIPRNASGVDLLGILNRSRGKTIGAEMSDTRSIRSNHSRTASMTINTRPHPELVLRPSSSHSTSYPPPSPAMSFLSRQQPPTPMSRTPSHIDEKGGNDFLERTKEQIIGLLLSDLGKEMWSGGSETDEWFSDGLADSCLERQRTRQQAATDRLISKGKKVASVTGGQRRPSVRVVSFEEEPPTPPLSRETSDVGTASDSVFDFKAAYKELLLRFSVHPTPKEKLKALFSLERLINASFVSISDTEGDAFTRPIGLPTPRPSIDMTRKASTSSAVGTDDLIDKLQEILRNPELRPKTLFRDLSFVSAFINPITLTHHGEGKVFWDIGLAALGMKEDVVTAMVRWYEEIMSGNERSRTRRRDQTSTIGGMKDAARMLVIAACEGNAVGQRELALLHLSHPSLLPLTTLPLTRPSDTFHKVSMKSPSIDKDKYDPDRIALATHWFRLAAKNGDKYAKNVEGNWLGSKKH
jgi:hypothetical protein